MHNIKQIVSIVLAGIFLLAIYTGYTKYAKLNKLFLVCQKFEGRTLNSADLLEIGTAYALNEKKYFDRGINYLIEASRIEPNNYKIYRHIGEIYLVKKNNMNLGLRYLILSGNMLLNSNNKSDNIECVNTARFLIHYKAYKMAYLLVKKAFDEQENDDVIGPDNSKVTIKGYRKELSEMLANIKNKAQKNGPYRVINKDGNLEEWNYRNGGLNGKYRIFNVDGIIILESIYKNGLLNGKTVLRNDKGEIINIIIYKEGKMLK